MHEIDRRSFIAASSALGLAGLAMASGIPVPPVQSESKRIRKSLKFGMIGAGETMLEKFQVVKACAFDGIELDSPGNWDLEEVKSAMDATSLAVPGVVLSTHWSKPFNHPDKQVRQDAKSALETAINDCKALGGSSVLVVPAVVNESMPYEEAYVRSKREIGELVPLAEKLGIDIAFENVWNNFLLSPIEAARYVDEFQSSRVGWYFDVGNVVNYGYPDQWIDTLGERIKKLDVKDFSRQKRNDEGLWKGFSVKIGDGDAGWERVCEALGRIGYRGWASAEVGGGGQERLAEIANRMDRVFSSLKDRP
ncbi:MAG: sugar phosphate isomerase/epimerase family protein [Phycisphaerales bacterium]